MEYQLRWYWILHVYWTMIFYYKSRKVRTYIPVSFKFLASDIYHLRWSKFIDILIINLVLEPELTGLELSEIRSPFWGLSCHATLRDCEYRDAQMTNDIFLSAGSQFYLCQRPIRNVYFLSYHIMSYHVMSTRRQRLTVRVKYLNSLRSGLQVSSSRWVQPCQIQLTPVGHSNTYLNTKQSQHYFYTHYSSDTLSVHIYLMY